MDVYRKESSLKTVLDGPLKLHDFKMKWKVYIISLIIFYILVLNDIYTRRDTLCRCPLSGLFWFAKQWILLIKATEFTKYQADLRCLANQNKPDNWQRHRVSQPVLIDRHVLGLISLRLSNMSVFGLFETHCQQVHEFSHALVFPTYKSSKSYQTMNVWCYQTHP